MRRTTPLVFLVLTGLLASCSETPTAPAPNVLTPDAIAPARSTADASAPTRYLVLFNGPTPKDFRDRVAELGGEVVLSHEIGVAIVAGLDDHSADRLERRVKARYVFPEPEFRLLEPASVRTEPLDAASLNASPMSASEPGAALYYGYQWNLHQVQAAAAWEAGRLGSPAVTVAILDTGIDYMIMDLAGRVDLNRSASFVPTDDALTQAFFPGRDLSTDLHFHGTNVASQVASNALVFAGVTSGATLISVKVCSVLGGCPGVVEGILHAIDAGADVINMSLGGRFEKADYPGAVAYFNSLFNYARQRGVTMLVAAGNETIDLDRNRVAVRDEDTGEISDWEHVPSLFSTYCDAPHVICVSATGGNDVPASYTNFGRSAVDVAAPGGDSPGYWVYSLCSQTSLYHYLDPTFPDCGSGLYLVGAIGTSQATPHVAGLAALAVEDVGRSPAKVSTYIETSADRIDGGNTPFYGKGRINVARAVGAY